MVLSEVQDLYEWNWSSRDPFFIGIVGYRPDKHVADLARRSVGRPENALTKVMNELQEDSHEYSI